MSDESTAVLDAPVSTESAPSSPASSTSSESAPAASTPSGASPSGETAEFTAPPRNPNEAPLLYMQRVREAREKHEKGEAPKPTEPVKPVEATKPGEPAKPADPQKTEVKTDAEPDDLIPETGIETTALAEKLKADPDLAAKLEAAGLKNAVFANARL